jgi:hypothetical protein
MWMMIPLNNGRDLADLVIVDREGEEWARFGSGLFRPLEGVPVLEVGGATLTVEVAGEAQWLQVPARGTLTIRNAAAWLPYDCDFVYQAEGQGVGVGTPALSDRGDKAWLMLHGARGDRIEVDVGYPGVESDSPAPVRIERIC